MRDVTIERTLGGIEEALPGHVFITQSTKVFARPDVSSFDWAQFRRGIAVRPLRAAGPFTQITYEEWDRFPVGAYITYQITGWVPSDILATVQRRTFYHLTTEAETPASWDHFADNHTFQVFWAPTANLPRLTEFQQRWLDYVLEDLSRPNKSKSSHK